MTTDHLDTLAIWAEGHNGANAIIGNSANHAVLPWPQSREDMRHFRKMTRGRVMVMGRTTFLTLPEVLKTPRATSERPIYVLTHNPTSLLLHQEPYIDSYITAGANTNPEWLRDHLNAVWWNKGIAVIGGTRVIEFMEPVIDRLSISFIAGEHEGDIIAPSGNFLQCFPVVMAAEQRTSTLHIQERHRVRESTGA